MPSDPRKRQKKLERREAKRKAKKEERGHNKPAGMAERLAAAAECPILHSWVSDALETQGIGWVCLSRQLPGGSVAFAIFLVDRYCLGVKDVVYNIVGRFDYDRDIVARTRTELPAKEVSPADARKIVESAVAYAEDLGLHPHPDYFKARALFGTIDASTSTIELEFGKDGKPFFVNGPNDTPQRCRQILRTLDRSCGPGGYHFMLGGPQIPLDEEDFEPEEWEDDDNP